MDAAMLTDPADLVLQEPFPGTSISVSVLTGVKA